MMALTLRPTGLGAGIDKDRPDHSVEGGTLIFCTYAAPGGENYRASKATLVRERVSNLGMFTDDKCVSHKEPEAAPAGARCPGT
jgi:hypothetical protein